MSRIGALRRRLVTSIEGAAFHPLVRRSVELAAPLVGRGARSRRGAATLARTIAVLAGPWSAAPPAGDLLGLDDLASAVRTPRETVERWARAGVLGRPAQAGPLPRWGRDALERVRLASYLRRRGVDEGAIVEAGSAGRLALLAVDRAIVGRGRVSGYAAAERAGVDPDFALLVWRSLGLAAADPADRQFSRREVEALRVVAAMRRIFPDSDILEGNAVIGRAMAQIAATQVELFLTHLAAPIAESGAGELERALRLSALADVLLPPASQLIETVYRRHLEAAVEAESIARLEASTGSIAGQVELAVGFVDLVGFTSASERLSPLELGSMAEALLRTGERVLPEHGCRIVKTIGDAVMFSAAEPIAALGASVAMLEAEAGGVTLPPARVGLAFGPVLHRRGDYFGRAVNIASRLCALAPAGVVWMLSPAQPLDAAALAAAGLAIAGTQRRELRGLTQKIEVLHVTRAPSGHGAG